MLSLTLVTILVVGFILLAVKYWNQTIGAGPTILIVGAIILSAFGAVKYDDYQKKVREFDMCKGRVDRSAEAYLFNNALVTIIERELPQESFGAELRQYLLEPLTMDDCPVEPEFFHPF